MLRDHPMFALFEEVKPNPKICVLTEPLWGIPHSLYMPFVSVHMLALGASDIQIGLVASLTLLFRTVTAALSGAITDKMGRRRATVIFDILSWSVPCLIWAMARNIYWFYAAAVFNGLWQITENSWTCLLVEDAEKSQLVNLYNWITLANQLVVFFGPLAGLLVDEAGIIVAMRILYGFSCVSMTAKFLILYIYGDETDVGRTRMRETKGQSLFAILAEYKTLIPRFFRSGDMKLAMVIAILVGATRTVMDSFFGVYATGVAMAPTRTLAYFPIARSLIVLLFIFFIQNRFSRFGYKGPMLLGTALYIGSHALMLFWPGGGLVSLWAYTILESCAYGLFVPRYDSIVALLLDPAERARMMSIMTVVVLGVNIPFGYIAGRLSDMNRAYPFFFNIVMFAVTFAVMLFSKRMARLGAEE